MHASVAPVAEWWGLTSGAFIVDQQKPAPWVFWITNRSRSGNSFEVYLCKTSKSLVTVTAFGFLSFETQDYSQMYLSQWFSLRIDHLGCLLLLLVSGVSVSGTSRLENHKCLRTSCRAHAYSQSKANMNQLQTPQLQVVHVSMYFRCTWWLLWLFDPPAQFLIRDIGSRDAHQSICSCSGAEFCWRVAWPYHWLQHQEMGSILCIEAEYNRI